jgi:hypothetical protein
VSRWSWQSVSLSEGRKGYLHVQMALGVAEGGALDVTTVVAAELDLALAIGLFAGGARVGILILSAIALTSG